MESVNCNICNGSAARPIYRINVSGSSLRYYRYARNIRNEEHMTDMLNIVRCKNCGLLYVNPRFDSKELSLVYTDNKVLGGNWENFPYLFKKDEPDELQILNRLTREEIQISDYDWRFEIIDKYATGPNKINSILDIGCGNGNFVYTALEKGFDAYGVDLSDDRICCGKENLNLKDKIYCGRAEDIFADRQFDIITLWDAIEHLQDPKSVLTNIKKLCHKNTRIFIYTMSLDSLTYKIFLKKWNYINPVQHLYYFSDKTMAELLNASGYALLGKEADITKHNNIFSLFKKILIGFANNLFFHVYAPKFSFLKIFKPIFKVFQNGISDERMHKRLENLYPGLYLGRYKDDFVYVAKPI